VQFAVAVIATNFIAIPFYWNSLL